MLSSMGFNIETNIKFHFKSQSVSVLNLRHLDFNNFHYVPLSVQGKSHLPQVRNL